MWEICVNVCHWLWSFYYNGYLMKCFSWEWFTRPTMAVDRSHHTADHTTEQRGRPWRGTARTRCQENSQTVREYLRILYMQSEITMECYNCGIPWACTVLLLLITKMLWQIFKMFAEYKVYLLYFKTVGWYFVFFNMVLRLTTMRIKNQMCHFSGKYYKFIEFHSHDILVNPVYQ